MSALPQISVVVPAFNEANSLPTLCRRIDQILTHELGETYELILVDDGSIDNTWDSIQRLTEQFPIRGLRLSRNFGKESALCAGIEMSQGEVVVSMDGDLQHPPELLALMIERWKETGCDLVEAVKTRAQNEGTASRLRAKIFYKVFSVLCGFDLSGMTDYKLLTSSAREAWLNMPERTLFFRGMTNWIGFHRETVQFQVPDIEDRHSRWSFTGLLRYALRNITAFTAVPLYLFAFLGLFFLFPAAILALDTLRRWFQGVAVEGFTTVIILVLLVGGLNFIGLSVLGLYLGRVYEEVKQRPRYIIRARTDQ